MRSVSSSQHGRLDAFFLFAGPIELQTEKTFTQTILGLGHGGILLSPNHSDKARIEDRVLPMKKSAPPLNDALSVPPLALNDILKIDTPARGSRCLVVAEIRQYSGGPNCPKVDYLLVRNPPGTPPLRLRVVPDHGGKRKVTHRPLVLTLLDSLPFNEGLLAVVQDDTKKFVIDDESEPGKHAHDEFWRVNDEYGSHVVGVNVLSGDGKPEEATVECWDYSRLIEANGVEIEEFMFVEMNKADGWFEIWRGGEVSAGKIAVM